MSGKRSYKSFVIDQLLSVASWFITISDFSWTFLTRLRHNILATIFDRRLSSLHIITKQEKMYTIWDYEKQSTVYLIYIYLKYICSVLYLPSIEISENPENLYVITTYQNNKKFYHISYDLEDVFHENRNILYAMLDDYDITSIIRGLKTQLPVSVIKEIACCLLRDIPADTKLVLKIMEDITFAEHIFKGTEAIVI